MKIEIASEMLLEFSGDLRYKCRFVGLIRDECVIVRIPVVPGIRDRVEPGRVLTFRYLHQGNIVSFSAVSRLYKATPYSLLFVAYPDDIEKYNLRHDRRIECRMQAKVTKSETTFRGLVVDMSESGCGFLMDANEDAGGFINVDDFVSGEFTTIDGKTPYSFKAKVARKSTKGRELHLGLVFNGDGNGLSSDIVRYLQEVRDFQSLLASMDD